MNHPIESDPDHHAPPTSRQRRPVLVPSGTNTTRPSPQHSKQNHLPHSKSSDKCPQQMGQDSPSTLSPPLRTSSAPSMLRHRGGEGSLLRSNLSLNVSCSSDASSDSNYSRASTGRIVDRRGNGAAAVRRRNAVGVVRMGRLGNNNGKAESVGGDDDVLGLDGGVVKRRCAWVTASTDPRYAAFHDEEWGVPVHDDSKLFELLSLSGALAELPWPTLLSKRDTFREVFLNFDPVDVSKLSEKKVLAPGSPGHSLLSELKLRAIIENARRICKVIDEFGSFDKYIWGFVNQNPIVSRFRYPRQVPVKTPKADVISKDLVRRGFRSVSPTVVYSFMQVAGLTNDHLISCFRFQECMITINSNDKEDALKAKNEEQNPEPIGKIELPRALDEISLCSDI